MEIFDTRSLKSLEEHYLHQSSAIRPKLQAEILYALAVALSRKVMHCGSDFPTYARARAYARSCLETLRTLPRDTLQDVAPVHTTLAGVTLPNYLYVEYVTNPRNCREFCALLQ